MAGGALNRVREAPIRFARVGKWLAEEGPVLDSVGMFQMSLSSDALTRNGAVG